MPLPGFNPMDKAPPPGSDRSPATASSIAQLHQRIALLERDLASMKSGSGSDWSTITGMGYNNPWGPYPTSAYTPSYRIVGDTVYLGGMIYPSAATSVGVMCVLPPFLQPAPVTPTQGFLSGALFFSTGINSGNAGTFYIYPHNSATNPGAISSTFAWGSGIYVSLHGFIYRKRPDM